MNNTTIQILGLDVGNSQIKTRQTCFANGIDRLTSEPILLANTMEYEGVKYQTAINRQKIRDNKYEDDIFFLQHLAAEGAELSKRGIHEAEVVLAVGTPIARFGVEKKKYIQYLNKKRDLNFYYGGNAFHVMVNNVFVFPQCYSAVVDRLPEMSGVEYVVDIGSWTVDYMKIVNRTPDEASCTSDPNGLITVMRKIDDVCVRKVNAKIDEFMIRQVMMNGTANLDQIYIDLIKEELAAYTKSILRNMMENGINIKTTPISFVGGGATLMKQYAGVNQRNITYIEDVRANAIGYETLAKLYMDNRK